MLHLAWRECGLGGPMAHFYPIINKGIYMAGRTPYLLEDLAQKR